MTSTVWILLGVAVAGFAIYWFKFRKKGAHLMHTKTGPQVVKKSGKKSWRHRLAHNLGGMALGAANAASGGQIGAATALGGSLLA